MKLQRGKALRYFIIIFFSFLYSNPFVDAQNNSQKVEARVKEILTINGKRFKDLNANGQLDDYENSELPVERRVAPFNEKQQFEEVGFTFNKAFITGLLREKLGFKGYVNTDTGAAESRPWGIEHFSIEERVAKAINAGTNIFSGKNSPQPIINAIKKGLVQETQINHSVVFLLTEMMEMGLFENPYVDPNMALETVNNPESRKRADLAQRKSIVLMRNDQEVLPLQTEKIKEMKLYVAMFPEGEQDSASVKLKEDIKRYHSDIVLTEQLEQATHALVWIQPKQDLLSKNPTITIGPETGIKNMAKIFEIQKSVPAIMVIHFSSPWLIDKIEPNAAAVIGTFGVKTEALLDVIFGTFNPTGKLPFTIPANKEAVKMEKGDVPGFAEDPSYVYKARTGDKFGYGFGLSYDAERKKASIKRMKDKTGWNRQEKVLHKEPYRFRECGKVLFYRISFIV